MNLNTGVCLTYYACFNLFSSVRHEEGVELEHACTIHIVPPGTALDCQSWECWNVGGRRTLHTCGRLRMTVYPDESLPFRHRYHRYRILALLYRRRGAPPTHCG